MAGRRRCYSRVAEGDWGPFAWPASCARWVEGEATSSSCEGGGGGGGRRRKERQPLIEKGPVPKDSAQHLPQGPPDLDEEEDPLTSAAGPTRLG